MNRALRPGVLLLPLFFGMGCSLFFDVDSVGLAAPRDTGGDLAPGEDADLGGDAADMTTDTRPDADLGDVDVGADADAGPTIGLCVDEPGTIDGECNPVMQDCPDGEVCDFQLISPDPVVFETRCRPLDAALDYSLAEGEPCETNPTDVTCAVGLKCRIDSCAQLCRLDDGTGCADGQACAEFASDIPEFGICADGC